MSKGTEREISPLEAEKMYSENPESLQGIKTEKPSRDSTESAGRALSEQTQTENVRFQALPSFGLPSGLVAKHSNEAFSPLEEIGKKIDKSSSGFNAFVSEYEVDEENRRLERQKKMRNGVFFLHRISSGSRDGFENIGEDFAELVLTAFGNAYDMPVYWNDSAWLERTFGASNKIDSAKNVLSHWKTLGEEASRTDSILIGKVPIKNGKYDEDHLKKRVETANKVLYGDDTTKYKPAFSEQEYKNAAEIADKRRLFLREVSKGVEVDVLRVASIISSDALSTAQREECLNGLPPHKIEQATYYASMMRAQTDNLYAYDVLREFGNGLYFAGRAIENAYKAFSEDSSARDAYMYGVQYALMNGANPGEEYEFLKNCSYQELRRIRGFTSSEEFFKKFESGREIYRKALASTNAQELGHSNYADVEGVWGYVRKHSLVAAESLGEMAPALALTVAADALAAGTGGAATPVAVAVNVGVWGARAASVATLWSQGVSEFYMQANSEGWRTDTGYMKSAAVLYGAWFAALNKLEISALVSRGGRAFVGNALGKLTPAQRIARARAKSASARFAVGFVKQGIPGLIGASAFEGIEEGLEALGMGVAANMLNPTDELGNEIYSGDRLIRDIWENTVEGWKVAPFMIVPMNAVGHISTMTHRNLKGKDGKKYSLLDAESEIVSRRAYAESLVGLRGSGVSYSDFLNVPTEESERKKYYNEKKFNKKQIKAIERAVGFAEILNEEIEANRESESGSRAEQEAETEARINDAEKEMFGEKEPQETPRIEEQAQEQEVVPQEQKPQTDEQAEAQTDEQKPTETEPVKQDVENVGEEQSSSQEIKTPDDEVAPEQEVETPSETKEQEVVEEEKPEIKKVEVSARNTHRIGTLNGTAYSIAEEVAFVENAFEEYRNAKNRGEKVPTITNFIKEKMESMVVRNEDGSIDRMNTTISPGVVENLIRAIDSDSRGVTAGFFNNLIENYIDLAKEQGEYGISKETIADRARVNVHKKSYDNANRSQKVVPVNADVDVDVPRGTQEQVQGEPTRDGGEKKKQAKKPTKKPTKKKSDKWEALTPSAENPVRVKGSYRIVDASELKFVDTTDKAQQDEQERNRQGHRTAVQILQMIKSFISERLADDRHTDRGAPIYRVLEDGTLRSVSGEGRSRLLKEAYSQNGEAAKAYRKLVEEFAKEHGLKIPKGVKNPVLLRVAEDTGGLSWAELAKASNADMKSSYSESEEAHADARELPRIIDLLNARSDQNILDDVDFVLAFAEAVGAGTKYTQDRKQGFKETLGARIENALVAFVIGDRDVATELFDSPLSLGSVLNTLRKVSVDLVRLRENAKYNIAPELQAALKAVIYVRNQKANGSKLSTQDLVEQFIVQQTLSFEQDPTDGIDKKAASILANLMLDKKRSLFGKALVGYVYEVEKENGINGTEASLFGYTGSASKAELLERAEQEPVSVKNPAEDVVYEENKNAGEEKKDTNEEKKVKTVGDYDSAVLEEVVHSWLPEVHVSVVDDVEEEIENTVEKDAEKAEENNEPFPLAPKSDSKKVKITLPVPFAGSKRMIIEAHSELFSLIGKLAERNGGRVIDAFAGAGAYTSGLGALGVLPKGSVINEYAVSRYVMHKMLAENPEGVAKAAEDIIKRLSESNEIKEFRKRLEEAKKGGSKEKLTQVLVDWFYAEYRGEHGVKYIKGKENSKFGDVDVEVNEKTAAFYVVLQSLMTSSHPVNFTIGKDGKPRIEVAGENFRTGHLSVILINSGYKFNENALKPEKYTKKILETGKLYKERGVKVLRGDGWELVGNAKKGDVVFVDPAYFGVQSYGGKKNVDVKDAKNRENVIKSLAKLIRDSEEKGYSVIYTNEYSDKSSKGGMSRAEYTELWKEAVKEAGKGVRVSVNYFDRGSRGFKESEGRSDIVFATGDAAHLLKNNNEELDEIVASGEAKTREEADKIAWERKTAGLSDEQKKEAERWKNARYQYSYDVKYINEGSQVNGAYLPNKNQVIVSRGANADTIMHELGWHATFDWARENSPELYQKMKDYAESAPEEVKARVRKLYGENISAEVFMDEVGAMLFTQEHAGKLDEVLKTKEAKTWWGKVKALFSRLWKSMLTALGKDNNFDIKSIAQMSPKEAMNAIAEAFVNGKKLGETYRKKISTEYEVLYEKAEKEAQDRDIKNNEIPKELTPAQRARKNLAARARERWERSGADQSYSGVVEHGAEVILAGMMKHGDKMNNFKKDEPDRTMEYAKKLFPWEDEEILNDMIEVAKNSYEDMKYARSFAENEFVGETVDIWKKLRKSRLEENVYATARRSIRKMLRAYDKANYSPKHFARAERFMERRRELAKQGRLNNGALQLPNAEFEKLGIPKFADFVKGKFETWVDNVFAAISEKHADNEPLMLGVLRKTLYGKLRDVARGIHNSVAAVRAMRILDDMLYRGNTAEQIVKMAKEAEAVIRDGSSKHKAFELREKILNLTAPFAKFSPKKVEKDRTTEGLTEMFMHYFREATYKSASEIESRIEELNSHINSNGGEGGDTFVGEAVDKRILALVQERGALVLALKYREGVDGKNAEILEYVHSVLEARRESGDKVFEDTISKAEERAKNIAETIADAIVLGRKNRAGESKHNIKHAVGAVFTGSMSLKQQLMDAIRYCPPGKVRDAAIEMIERLDKRIARADLKKAELEENAHKWFCNKICEIFGKEDEVKKLKSDKQRGAKATKIIAKLALPNNEYKKFSADGTALSYAQVLQIYSSVRQKDVQVAFEGMTPEEIDSLTPSAKALYNRIQQLPELEKAVGEKGIRFLDECADKFNQEAVEIDRVAFDIAGVPLTVRNKDYYPIARNFKKMMVNQAVGALSYLPNVMTPRTTNRIDIDESADAFSVFISRNVNIAHFIAFGNLHMDMGRVMANDKLSQNILKTSGQGMRDMLLKHVRDILSPKIIGGDEYEVSPATRLLLRTVATSALGGSGLIGLRQTSGIPAVVNEIGWRRAFLACLNLFTDPVGAIGRIKAIHDSAGWKERYGNDELSTQIEVLRNRGNGRLLKKFLRFYMINNRLGDSVPVLLIGQGLYGATKAELTGKMNPETGRIYTAEEIEVEALNSVWSTADKTQQASRTANAPSWNRINSPAIRLLTQFQSSTAQFLGYEVNALRAVMAQPKSKKAWQKLGTTLLINHLLLPGMYSLIGSFWKAIFGDDDDDEFYEAAKHDFIVSCIIGPASGIFVLGAIITAIASSSKGYLQGMAVPAYSWFNRLIAKGAKTYRKTEGYFADDNDGGEVGEAWDGLLGAICAPYREVKQFFGLVADED